MRQEVDCSVIRDLLPLYEDDVACEESRKLVREHLEDCPDCREELRKMRTPVSLPPDGDEELWERFTARRQKEQRKKRTVAICAGVVLAVILAAFGWYTRPRGWTEVAGSDPVDSLNASLTTDRNNFEAEAPEEKLGWNFWRLNEQDADSAVTDALLDLLNRYTYRSSLSNLRNFTPFPRDGHTIIGSTGYLSLSLYIQDHQECISLFLWSNGDVTVYYTVDSFSDNFLYRTDPALYEEMAALIREHGTLEEQE